MNDIEIVENKFVRGYYFFVTGIKTNGKIVDIRNDAILVEFYTLSKKAIRSWLPRRYIKILITAKFKDSGKSLMFVDIPKWLIYKTNIDKIFYM